VAVVVAHLLPEQPQAVEMALHQALAARRLLTQAVVAAL
jgi:hypothetical protein